MSEQLTQLQRLQAELHEINEDLAQVARPLKRLSELNEQQRQQVADQLRAQLARWDSVTQLISQVLGSNGATVVLEATTNGLTR
jgi:septal ring factor EnvC (AmiA/AmiB activator)